MLQIQAQSRFENVCIQRSAVGSYPVCEPSIAISALDPSMMVAGAVLDGVYTSSDSGRTWLSEQLKSKWGVYGDPCVISDGLGGFYYFHLSNPPEDAHAEGAWLDQIICQYSKDNGHSWSEGVGIGKNGVKNQDKEWAVWDDINKCLHLTWTQFDEYGSKEPHCASNIMYARSLKSAAEWSVPVKINDLSGDCEDGDQTVEGAVPAVGPEGQLYVAWAVGDSIYFDKSEDGGISWLSSDIVVCQISGGWDQHIPGFDRANGMPVLLCDLSPGPYRGRLYINFSDQRNGPGDTDIWMVYSDDDGDSWSTPFRVNDDGAGHQQFFPWSVVDHTTGHLYTVFYDRRAYENHLTDVYLAVSRDGGIHFENLQISEEAFDPRGVWFFGDYNNISAVSGVVRPVWTRVDEGKSSIWTALIHFP